MLEEESQTVWVTNLCLPGPEPFHTAVLLYTVHTPINSSHFNVYFPLPSHITVALRPYMSKEDNSLFNESVRERKIEKL